MQRTAGIAVACIAAWPQVRVQKFFATGLSLFAPNDPNKVVGCRKRMYRPASQGPLHLLVTRLCPTCERNMKGQQRTTLVLKGQGPLEYCRMHGCGMLGLTVLVPFRSGTVEAVAR